MRKRIRLKVIEKMMNPSERQSLKSRLARNREKNKILQGEGKAKTILFERFARIELIPMEKETANN